MMRANLRAIAQAAHRDPRKALLDSAGPMTDYEIFHNLVLVATYVPSEKIGSIIVPVSEQEKQKWATTEGTLIAVSPLAFTYAKCDEWKDAGATPPKPGDRILFAKYAGTQVKGKDGKEYVLANDKDVMAILTD